ncbi:MAG: tetratricopeptide repeat protein, partial [Chloroflexota bacterium]
METNPLDSMINHEKMPPTGTQRVSMPDVDTVVDINPISTHVGRPPGHLPIVAEAFIGREAEIAALIERLEQPGIRLVTILAPGGMGKSRLAIEVGARMINHDTSGANFERVVYANMEAVQDAAGIVDALATAIGYSFTADVDLAPNDTTGRLQRLINYVQHQRLLMVIDRFEHLLEHARLIGQLHNNAPDLQILVTSRERLKVAGEDIFPLEGMRTDAHSLDQNTAAQLFVHSAQRITPSFTLEPEDFNNVQRICRLLDGTPLGIVLAATWVEYLSVSDIADELASDINMLSTDRVDIPERQRSLTAVLESSWQRLTPELQKKVIPFFVFRGDFTREAAQEMSGANLMDLRRLVDRAILVRDPLDGHFTVHEIIRQYAERLAREQELYDSLRQKHARYYLRMLHQGEDNLLGQAQRHMIRRIENDIENVEAAWLAAVEYEQVVLLHGALDALHWFAVFRGQWQTVTGLLEKAHQTAARHPGDPHWQLLAARILPRVLDVRAIDMGDLQAAMQTVWEQGDTRAQVGTLLAAGRILKERATLAEARSTFEQVLTMVEEPEDAFYKALALSEFAMCQLDSGETERGIESMNRAMTIQQKSGDEIGQARSLRRLGYLYWMQGNYPEARKRMSQALSYERVIGSPQMVAQSLAALANVTLLEADFDAVTTLTTEAIETARAYKHRRAHGWALIVQGNMANAHNEIDRAIELFKQGLQLVGPNVDLVYDAYWGLSVAHCTSGDFAMAKEHNQNDLAYAVRVKSPAYMALYLPVTAAILAAEGDHDSAIDVLGSALNHVAAPLALLQHLSFVEEVKVQLADVFGDDFDARWQAAASLSLEAVSERYAGPLE